MNKAYIKTVELKELPSNFKKIIKQLMKRYNLTEIEARQTLIWLSSIY